MATTTVNTGTGSGGVGTSLIRILASLNSGTEGGPVIHATEASNANSPWSKTLSNLSNGANTITVDTKASACLIIPPSGNIISMTLKGVSGDTGFGIHPAAPTLISFPSSPPTTFVITAGGSITGVAFYFL